MFVAWKCSRPYRVAVCIFVTCICVTDGHVSYAGSGKRKMDHVIVKERAFPYAAAIFSGSEYVCTGALINKRLVVTAASALDTQQGKVETLRVRVGSKSKTSGGVTLSVEQIYRHPSYTPGLPEYDVALLALKQHVITSPLHSAITTGTKKCSPKQFYSPMWFKEGKVEGDNNALRVSRYAVAGRQWCRQLLAKHNVTLTNNIACLLPNNGHACLRDVGAPLVDVAPQPTQIWAVISSWNTADCGTFPAPILATRLTAKGTRGWLQMHLKATENNTAAITRARQLG